MVRFSIWPIFYPHFLVLRTCKCDTLVKRLLLGINQRYGNLGPLRGHQSDTEAL